MSVETDELEADNIYVLVVRYIYLYRTYKFVHCSLLLLQFTNILFSADIADNSVWHSVNVNIHGR